MIVKVCQFQAHRQWGEKLVEVFQPGEMEKAASFFSLGKTAAPLLPSVRDLLETIRPNPRKIYILVNALGAGEYWGSNINGDYFPETALIHQGPDYGYETFRTAGLFKHHVNKDPSRSFGNIMLSAWHDHMKRVELVIEVDRDKATQFGATDVCDKLDQGIYPDVSMGCKVPYDLCSSCTDWKRYEAAKATFDQSKHKSVSAAVLEVHKRDPIRGVSITRNDYCEHLRKQLNKIMPNGMKNYAINDYPRFFDISVVFIGADKTAKVMAKLASVSFCGETVPSWQVAEESGYAEEPMEKAASSMLNDVLSNDPDRIFNSIKGRSDIDPGELVDVSFSPDKRIRHAVYSHKDTPALTKARLHKEFGKEASEIKAGEIEKDVVPSQFGGKAVPAKDDIPNDILDTLGKGDLSEALSTPTMMGMILRPREFQRITIISMGNKPLADELDSKGIVFPHTDEDESPADMGSSHFSDVIKKLLMPLMEGRSSLEPVAKRRMVRIIIMGGPKEEPSLSKTSSHPFMKKLSSAYNGYLREASFCLRDVPGVVGSDATLWSAVHGRGIGDALFKVADGANPAHVVGAAVVAEVISVMARRDVKRQELNGQQAGLIEDLIASHPHALASLAALGALHAEGSSLPKDLLAKLTGIGKTVISR